MNMQFFRKLPIPKDVKEEYPLSSYLADIRKKRLEEIKNILSGKSDKLLLIAGPCSADNRDSVLDYVSRLARLEDEVKDKIFIIPRVYTNKPRTTGDGYKGMLHQPDPNRESDLLKGLIASRMLHMDVLRESGMATADEMLYPENHRYFSDILGYVAVGARSVEDQQHRLTASGLDIPVGMKNPMSGDLSVMLNSVTAAQHSHTFIYRGWEVKSTGNEYAHAVLRGYTSLSGETQPNYKYDSLMALSDIYSRLDIKNRSVIVDLNHANSGKKYLDQVSIGFDVMESRNRSKDIHALVKGLMLESYIEDGRQDIGDHETYGRSITDPCLGWDKTREFICKLADCV